MCGTHRGLKMLSRVLSAVVLAGGRSTRLGQDKVLLPYRGVSFVQHQVHKLRELGVEDVIVSGYEGPVDGAASVPDVYPHSGPLGGMHAGLSAARNTAALVLAVDTPLLPVELLDALARAHGGGITVLEHGGKTEPLIGVYDSAIAAVCEEMLRSGRRSVYGLLDRVGYRTVCYQGDEKLLLNCNTPEDYALLTEGPVDRKAIAICGVKNSGKTTLIRKLLKVLAGRGIRTAVIKHDGHDFTCDIPGTDSYQFSAAGAYGVAVCSDSRMFVHKEGTGEQVSQLIALFPEADLILIEGMKDSTYPKVEVIRRAVSDRPVSCPTGRFLITTDWEPGHFQEETAGLEEIERIADSILRETAPRRTSPCE